MAGIIVFCIQAVAWHHINHLRFIMQKVLLLVPSLTKAEEIICQSVDNDGLNVAERIVVTLMLIASLVCICKSTVISIMSI